MKISVTKIVETEEMPEQLIYRSIQEYINKSSFPKNLVIKNLIIQENHTDFKLKNVNTLLLKGIKALDQLRSGNSSLKKECSILLDKLKIY